MSKTTRRVTGRKTVRVDPKEERPQPPRKDPTMMYVAIGGGAVLLLVLVAMASGGSSSRRAAVDVEGKLSRFMGKINEARSRGDHRLALELADEAVNDPVIKKSRSYKDLQALTDSIRSDANAERDAVGKVAEFKRRVDLSKEDQTAMQKAQQFWEECNGLLQSYGTTSSAPVLRGIREDLRRWIATESQTDWQKDYNRTKERIKSQYLETEKFASAVQEWRRFGETAQDPLLHSKVESEILFIDNQSATVAQKMVGAAAGGTEDRDRLERALQDFAGTQGGKIINQKLKSMK